ncbi:M23 family metallopeptidase [Pseudomonas knackmussii]|uniref:M23 family metallopeptidase n=1 Tax=Pseudomonas knackmussii TaxID=65741 RepID=UPI003BBB8F36
MLPADFPIRQRNVDQLGEVGVHRALRIGHRHGNVDDDGILQRGAERHLPVRAIADATLAYVRQPTPVSADPAHPLNLNGKWSDDGCIVLRHETEIGEGDQARVVFYSIYLHLSAIELADCTVGAKVYRKDVLGQAGSINGRPARIHFELIANDAAKAMGRTTAELRYTTASGRRDSCWGDAHFYLLPEALSFDERPRSWSDPKNREGTIVWRPHEELFIRLRYERGQCTLSTFDAAGELIGEHHEAKDFEYDLFQIASERYPECPSAGYELLRYGRVFGPDALQPRNAAHWRQIALRDRKVWVNLNFDFVTRFSDADFPHWLGWRLIDDDCDPDGHCQSPTVRALLELDQDPLYPDQTDAIGIANSPAYDSLPAEHKDALAERYAIESQRNQAKLNAHHHRLQRCIFKFPSEWTKDNFDTRYGWRRKIYGNRADEPERYARMKAHQQALAFWEDARLTDIDSPHWHLPPRAFIEAFRKCGWLSANEMAQLLPMTALRKVGGEWRSEPVAFTDRDKDRLEVLRIELNKSLRAHGIAGSPLRLAAFFGNAMQETQWFSKLHENNRSAWYFPWDGRGFLQLTHAENYIKYWRFRGHNFTNAFIERFKQATRTAHAEQSNSALQDYHFPSLSRELIQWREDIATGRSDPSQSAAAYWSWSGAAKFADEVPHMVRETVGHGSHTLIYYSSIPFGQVAATVNYGSPMTDPARISRVNGIQARYQGYVSALMTLSEGYRFRDIHGHQQEQPDDYLPRRV